MATDPDYYALLSVPASAGLDEIRSAYLRLVFQWHPDRNPSAEATRRTIQINAAWEVLQDPARRAVYDRRRGRVATPTGRAASNRDSRSRSRTSPAPDPAAAARARRAAEATAREAEARRRRDAEHERRRNAAAPLWQPPPEAGLGWADRAFVAGHWYRNNRGPYKVIDVRGTVVDIYYADGEIVTMRHDELWEHWQRQVQRRRRQHGAGHMS